MDYVQENDGIFIHPCNDQSTHVLKFNKDGKLRLIPIEEADEEENLPLRTTHNLIGESKFCFEISNLDGIQNIIIILRKYYQHK